jgi:ribosomal protein S18 acetylase RimI-like enzyme
MRISSPAHATSSSGSPASKACATRRPVLRGSLVAMPDWIVRPGSLADLELLAPLWVAVHHQHSASMAELRPYVDDEETWSKRRELYLELLAKPDTILLVAMVSDQVIGYGLAHVMDVDETWIADTWQTGRRIGEIETVSVLPEHRGGGLGSYLLDELERQLAAHGIDDLILGVLPGNVDAIRLYERRGYRSTWLYLSRLEGRPGHPG